MMTRTEADEMEEGELPEEGELLDEPSPGKEKQKQSKSKTFIKDLASTVSEKEEPNDDVGPENMMEFLKKKRRELAEKVKNQLRVESRASTDSTVASDEENSKKKSPVTESVSKTTKNSSTDHHGSRRSSNTVVIKTEPGLTSSKYREFESTKDPTEIMVSSWMKGSMKKSSSGRNRSEPSLGDRDPNEEYYGTSDTIASPPPTDVGTIGSNQDQDYRLIGAGDQDYRIPAPPAARDVDYRRERIKRESPDESFVNKPYPDSPTGPATTGDGNSFGDIDERRTHERRVKRIKSEESDSESGDDEHRNYKRHRRASPGPQPTAFHSRRGFGRWGNGGERPICKFYREGYCREGESCNFSHDIRVEKRPELCKFYMQGYCRNGNRCPYLHGEFPCKEFHKGEECRSVAKGEECRFSHEPLNDVTRPLYEQMVKDEELASRVSNPNAKSARKVLLAAPPPPQSQMPVNNRSPYHESGGPNRMTPPPMFQQQSQSMPDQMRQRYRSPSPPPFFHGPPPHFDQFGPNQGPPGPFFNPMGGRPGSPPFGPGGGPPPFGGGGPPPFGPGGGPPQFGPGPQQFGPGGGPPQFGPGGPQNFGPRGPPFGPGGPPMGGFGHPPMNMEQFNFGPMMPMNQPPPDMGMPPPAGGPSQGQSENVSSMDIQAMLRQIRAEVKGEEEVEESPASPEPSNDVQDFNTPPRPRTIAAVVYRLIQVDVPSIKSALTATLLQASLTDSKLRSDPRIKNLLSTQFNAGSELILQQNVSKDSPPSAGMSRDPRARRDPRLSRQQNAAATSASSSSNIDSYGSLQQQQIPIESRFEQSSSSFPPITDPNVFLNNPSTMGPGGWMPQTSLVNLSTPMPTMAPINVSNYQFSSNGQSMMSGSASSPPHQVHNHFSGPMMSDSPPSSSMGKSDPRQSSRNVYQSRHGRRQSPNSNVDDVNQYFANFQNDQQKDHQQQEFSLRERRKDLQYESPLN